MVKLPRPACLPDSGYVHSQDPEEEDWPEGPFLACAHLGPLGRVCCCRHPHRLGSRSPLTLAAPGAPMDCAPHPTRAVVNGPVSPGWPLNPGFWLLRGRRDGEGAGGMGKGQMATGLRSPALCTLHSGRETTAEVRKEGSSHSAARVQLPARRWGA